MTTPTKFLFWYLNVPSPNRSPAVCASATAIQAAPSEASITIAPTAESIFRIDTPPRILNGPAGLIQCSSQPALKRDLRAATSERPVVIQTYAPVDPMNGR